jgi:hypothetical protein
MRSQDVRVCGTVGGPTRLAHNSRVQFCTAIDVVAAADVSVLTTIQ